MMSILDTMDFNNPLLTWKISPKKQYILTPVATVPTSEISSVESHTLTQMTNVNPMHTVEMTSNVQVATQPMQQEIKNDTAPCQPVKKKHKSLSSIRMKRKHKNPVDGMMFHSQQLGLKIPPKKTLGIKGMVIHSQAREVIHNVYKFMKQEAQNGTMIPISNYRERVLAATGISKCTYTKITAKEFVHGISPPFRKKKRIGIAITVDGSSIGDQPSENDNLYRPKINRDASTRDGVYNLEDVVPSYILDTLIPEATTILTLNTTDMGLSPFVMECISKVVVSQMMDNDKVRSITIFLYIHYLIKFINTPMKSVTKKFVVCDKSSEVNQHILDNFSVNSPGGRTRPLHMKDKCLCYIIVLAAIANEYEVNVTSLSKDLKIGIKKAMEISRILAFNASMKNKNVVTLNLPLPPPVSFNSKRKRK